MRLQAIEIQHFLHLDARVIDAVRALPVPYDLFVHDYAWICPRVTLIDDGGRYCGEPAVSVCQRCVSRPALVLAGIRCRRCAHAAAAGCGGHVAYWHLRSTPRHGCASISPVLRYRCAPTPRLNCPQLPAARADRKILRIALLGAIGDHKGYQVLLACARNARLRRLPLEFVVIGYTCNDAPLLPTGKVFVTGRYSESEAPHLLRREQPDVVWLPSVWPETWCYALDHALGTGLPVVAFDLGAIAERLRAAGTGVLLPLELAPREINESFVRLLGSPGIPAPQSHVLFNRGRRRSHLTIRSPGLCPMRFK